MIYLFVELAVNIKKETSNFYFKNRITKYPPAVKYQGTCSVIITKVNKVVTISDGIQSLELLKNIILCWYVCIKKWKESRSIFKISRAIKIKSE